MILVDEKEDLTGKPRDDRLDAIGESENDTEPDADAEKGVANRAVIAAVLDFFVAMGASVQLGAGGKMRKA
jgi:uncharacterized protein YggU (UPF0235/DUF167 family)